MKISEIVKKINDISKIENEQVRVLRLLKLVEGVDSLDDVLSSYEKFLEGNLQIVEVITMSELENSQKTKLETKLKQQFKQIELIFDYKVQNDAEELIQIKLNQKLIKFSL